MTHSTRRREFLTFVGSCLLSRYLPAAEGSLVVRIEADAKKALGPLKNIAGGANHVGEEIYPGAFAQYADRAREIGLKQIRGMSAFAMYVPRFVADKSVNFNYQDVVTRDEAGQLHYDWTTLDAVVDEVLAIGAQPILELAYMPTCLMDHKDKRQWLRSLCGLIAAPPVDYARWEEICFQVVHHTNIERRRGVQYWEAWNEPTCGGFWPASFDEYLKLYRHSVAGVKRADPKAKVGGPVIATNCEKPKMENIQAFIDFCGREQIPCDFLSWHHYTMVPGTEPSDLQQFTEQARTFRSWLNKYPSLSPAELMIDEWGPQKEGWGERLFPSIWAGAAIYTMMEAGVDRQHVFTLWGTPAADYHLAILKHDGTIMPVFNVLKMFSMLGTTRLSAQSSAEGTRVLAAQTGKEFTLLVIHTPSQPAEADITLSLQNLPLKGNVRYERFLVDEEHSNGLKGRANQELERVESRIVPVSRKWEETLRLRTPSATLVRLSPA
jgi:xylan 1,4-beta-xylosidase